MDLVAGAGGIFGQLAVGLAGGVIGDQSQMGFNGLGKKYGDIHKLLWTKSTLL